MICGGLGGGGGGGGGLRVGPSAPLALPPSVFHGFILLAPCSRVLENLARLTRLDASAGFVRRCWRNTHPQKKEGSKSPLLLVTITLEYSNYHKSITREEFNYQVTR